MGREPPFRAPEGGVDGLTAWGLIDGCVPVFAALEMEPRASVNARQVHPQALFVF